MNEPDNHLHQEIMEKIQSGQVAMRSRAYLAWRAVLWGLAILLFVAAGAFIVSFMVFICRASGVCDLPQFGLHGLQEFLVYFPWLFVPAALLFVWLVEKFVRQYAFVYRLPLLYSILGVTAMIVVFGLVVVATPLQDRLYEFAEQQQLPVAGSLYRFFGANRPDDFYVGRLTAVSGGGDELALPEGGQVAVVIGPQTSFPGGRDMRAGDDVEVIGEEQSGSVQALVVKKISPASLYPMRRQP